MNRTALAAILATAGFVAVAAGPLSAQTAPAPAPQDNADRTITRDEALAQADARFDRMDANKDGKLDSTEMAMRRQATMQPGMAPGAMPPPPPAGGAAPPPPAPGGRLMARLDTNGDGTIDRAEFRAQAERRFDRIDANKDGKLDPDERQAARDAMGMRRGGAGGDMPPPPPAAAPKPDAGE